MDCAPTRPCASMARFTFRERGLSPDGMVPRWQSQLRNYGGALSLHNIACALATASQSVTTTKALPPATRGPAHGRPAARRRARRPPGGARPPSPAPLLLGPLLQKLAQRTALRGEPLARAPQQRVERVPLAQPLRRGGLPLRFAPQPPRRGERCLQACDGGREAGGLRRTPLVHGSRSRAQPPQEKVRGAPGAPHFPSTPGSCAPGT